MDGDGERWMVDALNDTQADLPDLKTVHHLFGRAATTTPDAVAVEDGVESLTYGELDRISDAIAATLQSTGIGVGGRVAVAMSRSARCLATLLAVMKTGNAYVPLDPAQPEARLRMILQAADVAGIVHDQEQAPTCATGLDLSVIALSDVPTGAKPAAVAVSGDPTAYVMFTSGSTGVPKGVEVGHRSVVNLLTSMAGEPGFDHTGTLLAVTTIMFDISVLELFLPLICGGRCVIAAQGDVLDGFKLVERIKAGDITHVQATPTLWSMLLEAGLQPSSDLTLLAGGEPLPADLAAKLTENGAALWNVYGPTETTIWSAIARVEPGAPITIGHPIANTQLHVLDARDALAPIGAVGELNIGGAGLAKGYFRRPDLTAAAFRTVTLYETPRLLYKTGDLARRMADGSIQVLGRNDGQVKLRGFRIELGDIETALRSLDGVKAAATALRPSPRGDTQLVGYVIAEAGHDLNPEDLVAGLSGLLPGYMVPSAWVHLSSLPQTGNGKLDRNALPAPEAVATVTTLREPKTPTERRIAEIWQAVLGVENLSTTQTLFALGVDSLTIFRIAARMIETDLNVEARHLLEHPSIEKLAAFADSRTGQEATSNKPSLKSYRGGARRGL
jgi:amino acid adenylation domain-containing protein